MNAPEDQKKGFLYSNRGEKTDFTIKLGLFKWHVHKAVLSSQSKFFKVVCEGAFKEAQENEVTLHDDDPCILVRLIQWVYTGSFSYDHTLSLSCFCPSLQILMRQGRDQPEFKEKKKEDKSRSWEDVLCLMYQLAEKYDIAKLRQDLAADLVQRLDQGDSVLFERYLFKVCELIWPSLHEFVELKKIIAKRVARHIVDNTATRAFRRQLNQQMMTQDHEFCLWVMRATQKRARENSRELGKAKRKLMELGEVVVSNEKRR